MLYNINYITYMLYIYHRYKESKTNNKYIIRLYIIYIFKLPM